MKNYEKLKLKTNMSVDEIAVGMLIERIKEDVDLGIFQTFPGSVGYIGIYNQMKDWLNSEVKE